MQIMKIDGVDVPIEGCASMSESALLILRSAVPVRVGALFDYQGKEHRVTECEWWQDYHKTFSGYKIVTVRVEDEEWFNNHSMLGPKKPDYKELVKLAERIEALKASGDWTVQKFQKILSDMRYAANGHNHLLEFIINEHVINLEGVKGKGVTIAFGESGSPYVYLFSTTPVDIGVRVFYGDLDRRVVECKPGETENRNTGEVFTGYWIKAANEDEEKRLNEWMARYGNTPGKL